MIFDLINGILAVLTVPYYFNRAEFAEGEEPPLFITYDIYDVPAERGDGEEIATEYVVTFNIFGRDPGKADKLYKELLGMLLENDFVRAGCNYSSTDNYPEYFRRSVDFNYIYYIEEDY
ncbi:MAG: hypothetical protein IJ192_03635 [Clostridia bacterium]|nr:hypothetical protein [Clostridia bacterium]MBR2175336.1 hypothetical protein [Clostridia bacterium]